MKVAILNFCGTKVYPGIEKDVGIGASDRAMLELSKHLAAAGMETHFFTNGSYNGKHEGATWHSSAPEEFECDVLIVNRSPLHYDRFNAKKIVYYSHDDIDAPIMKNMKDFLVIADHVFCLSSYHHKRLCSLLPDPMHKKISVVPEGLPKIQRTYGAKNKHHVVFASAPFKGLHVLMKLWRDLKKEIPTLHLHICSSMELHGAKEKDIYFETMYADAIKDEQVTYHGNKSNEEVFKIMQDCELMIYPNTYPETFCNAANESINAVTPVITTKLGALPETVKDCGVLIEGDARTKEYQQKFIAAVKEILESEEKLEDLKINCANRHQLTWSDVAQRVIYEINNLCEVEEIGSNSKN